MSVSQALSEGLQVTGVGLIIVFSVLIILMLVMMAMKAIFYKPESSDKPKNDVAEVTTLHSENPNDNELIAVLTAAVAAYTSAENISNLKIKSYKKVGRSDTSWQRSGRNGVINSRF